MKDNKVEIIEVGPRDGFQNVSDFIPTDMKILIIEGLLKAGIKYVQITSFVHPKAIPQMRDAKEITKYCLRKYPDLHFFALVPNLYGAQTAVECGLKEVSYVISVSEAHNFKNVRRTHDQSFSELLKIINLYPDIKINLDVATAFGCHYEGEIPLNKVMKFIVRAYGLGVRSFNLCDTVGLAHPNLIKVLGKKVVTEFPDCEFQVHIHDTRNMGIINSYTAIECGIHRIQTSIGGLGGCPFAPGASGNTSTEDLVYMLNAMGYDTGIDFQRLFKTAELAKKNVNGNFSGHHLLIDQSALCHGG